MVRRFHRSIYDELDELRASMDYLYRLALEPADELLLPLEETPEVVCQYMHTLNAEVTVHDDEVTVTVDTVPAGNTEISANLLRENLLGITVICDEDKDEGTDGMTVPEQRSLSLHRMIVLPEPVTDCGARLSLRHGVLDLHLKKARPRQAGNP